MDYGLDLIVRHCRCPCEGQDRMQVPIVEGLMRSTDPSNNSVVELSGSTLNQKQPSERDSDPEDINEQGIAADGLSARFSKSTRETAINSTPLQTSSAEDYSVDERRPSKACKEETAWPTRLKKGNPAKFLCTDRLARSESEAWEVAHAQECFRRDSRK